jgi:uncharacterized protein
MKFREIDVTIQSKVALKGTVSFPVVVGKKNPAVLIIPGTGKLDRNGKINKKLDLKLYRQLAEFLSSIGFITLRYDKRGVGESEGDYLETGLWDLVDDTKAAVHYLKALPEVNSEKVIVLGHSEGATIGTAVAAREQLGGLILLAGAIERISEALKRQRDIATEDILNAKGFQGFLLRLLGTHKKVETQALKYTDKVLKSKKDVMRVGLIKTNAKWMREHFAYNVREDLVKVTCPVLAITGSLDIQADPEILKDLPKYLKADAHYHVVDNMSHSLKFQAAASTMFSAKKDIVASGVLPIHPELINLLEKWLEDRYVNKSNEEPVVI